MNEITRGIHVVYSTIPEKNAKSFVKSLEKKFYTDYKRDIGYSENTLYTPLKYFMLGDFDYCQISLINNFKFTQRLFEISEGDDDHIRNYGSHTLQSYTGFCLNKKEDSENIFSNKIEKYFVGIIHLKLNNGLYLGNGIDFIEEVQKIITKTIGNNKHLLSQSFSWFELSLVVFVDSPKELANTIAKLRALSLNDLDNSTKIFENCLYNDFKFNKNKIYNTSLFADTNSSIGFREDIITCDSKSDEYKKFKLFINDHNISLKTEIEWKLKR